MSDFNTQADMSSANICNNSLVEVLNSVRVELWRNVYSRMGAIELIVRNLRNTFPDNTAIDFIPNQMKFVIQTKNIESSIKLNAKLLQCFKNVLIDLYQHDYIDNQLYNECIQAPSLLYNLTLNYKKVIEIKL